MSPTVPEGCIDTKKRKILATMRMCFSITFMLTSFLSKHLGQFICYLPPRTLLSLYPSTSVFFSASEIITFFDVFIFGSYLTCAL